MLCHASDQLRNALGEMEAQAVPGPLARAPLNWVIIHLLPWPKRKAQSPPEFLAQQPSTWDDDVGTLKMLMLRFAARGRNASWPASPVFGKISGGSWGVLAYRHLDHHLRQFGV